MGTRASTVVKVKLPATCGKRPSFRRPDANQNKLRICGHDIPRIKILLNFLSIH
jgi:hypothetical protein